MKKLYGRAGENSELVHDKAHWLELVRESGESIELELFLPEPHWSPWFFCNAHQGVTLASIDVCGRHCGSYAPRNGKSGCCHHRRKCHEPTGQIFKLDQKGRLTKCQQK